MNLSVEFSARSICIYIYIYWRRKAKATYFTFMVWCMCVKRPVFAVCDTRLCNTQFITMQPSQCTIQAIWTNERTEKALFLAEKKKESLAFTNNQLNYDSQRPLHFLYTFCHHITSISSGFFLSINKFKIIRDCLHQRAKCVFNDLCIRFSDIK